MSPQRLQADLPLSLASHTLKIISTSSCCHLVITGSTLSFVRRFPPTPDTILAVSPQVVLPGFPLGFLQMGPSASHKPLHPLFPSHKPRMASTVPPLSTSMEPEQTK